MVAAQERPHLAAVLAEDAGVELVLSPRCEDDPDVSGGELWEFCHCCVQGCCVVGGVGGGVCGIVCGDGEKKKRRGKVGVWGREVMEKQQAYNHGCQAYSKNDSNHIRYSAIHGASRFTQRIRDER